MTDPGVVGRPDGHTSSSHFGYDTTTRDFVNTEYVSNLELRLSEALAMANDPLLTILLSALYKLGGVVIINRQELYSDFDVKVDVSPVGGSLEEADTFTLTVTKNAGS